MSARFAKRAIAALCLVLSACGFCDQPLETGVRSDDGIAPWRQAGRVEICVGPARMVAPAALPDDSGVCLADTAAQPSCARDAECGDREACICGRCSVQLCRFSTECPAGLSCAGTPRRCVVRCTTDDDCPLPLVCDGQACTGGCAGDADCASGERCLAGRCGVLPCGAGGPSCGAGETCAAQQVPGAVAAPSAIAGGRGTVLYLELADAGGGASILRADSRDGIGFVATPSTPVITPPSGSTRAGAPSALARDGGVEVFFSADDASGGAAIARARSSDGIAFETPEVVLMPAAAWEMGRVSSPHALAIGSDVLLFYEGGEGAGIGVARSAGGGPFERITVDAPLVSPADVETSERWSEVAAVGAPGAIYVETPLGQPRVRLYFTGRGVEAAAGSGPDGGSPPANDSIGLLFLDVSGADPQPWPWNPVVFRIRALASLEEREPTVIVVENEWRLYFDDAEGSVFFAVASLP